MSHDRLDIELTRLREMTDRYGLNQSAISMATGVSQPQISRILRGKLMRRTHAFDLVLAYVEQHSPKTARRKVIANEVLISALASVWDLSLIHI